MSVLFLVIGFALLMVYLVRCWSGPTKPRIPESADVAARRLGDRSQFDPTVEAVLQDLEKGLRQ